MKEAIGLHITLALLLAFTSSCAGSVEGQAYSFEGLVKLSEVGTT